MKSAQAKSLVMCSIVFLVFFIPGGFPDMETYIDLSTGSLIIQVLAASLIAGVAFIKAPWRKVKSFVGHLFDKKKDNAS